MLCRYSWLDLKNQPHPAHHPNCEVYGFQTDTEDFKKLFRRCQQEWRACIVWLSDGNTWIWQNKRFVIRGGWQLAVSEKPPVQMRLRFYNDTRLDVIKKALRDMAIEDAAEKVI